MKSAALFCAAIWIIVLGSNAAPYVHHHQDNPDPTTQTETGPQMREMNSLLSLFNDLFNFMDILMDPQSYTNHHESPAEEIEEPRDLIEDEIYRRTLQENHATDFVA
eukprot:00827.XXX_243_1022_1 [CDS] Oithona nana genome sequencing.